jgi:T5SS/PEP-CTERM-associated repeat protein
LPFEIGRALGVDGTLNVIGGSFHGDTIYVGEGGSGTMNVTAGGSASNNLGIIGYTPSSTGTATISGAGALG